MNVFNKITDKDFVPFLQSLGVDTYNKSFEWMLNEPEFAGVLEWMYTNLDGNNVLSPREISRYSEIEKNQVTPTPDELDAIVTNIQNDYPGICVPGDQERMEDVKLDISMLKERLHVLEKQEKLLKDLVKQNESTNEQLNLDITKINGICQQYADEEKATADECVKLAEEVEKLTDDVILIIADAMDIYTGCWDDKEAAKKFYTFGPFDKYKQSQDLFHSHFDLYTSKKFPKRIDNNTMDYNGVLNEAKIVERRLSDAIISYIESKAELSGEQAKLSYVTNFNAPHLSQFNSLIIEAQSAAQLLEQEEGILDSQLQNTVKQYVEERTALVEETAAKSALSVREELHTNISHILDMTQQALALDKVLYGALRYELRNVEEFLSFAAQLRQYVVGEAESIDSRTNSMNEICYQQDTSEQLLLNSDILIQSLLKILGTDSNDANLLIKLYNNMVNDVRELKNNIKETHIKRIDALDAFKISTVPLKTFIWDGCTKQPNAVDRTVSSLTHKLRNQMADVEKRVVEATAMFKTVKNGDKKHLRKLWQWFLTDPAKLFAVIKSTQTKSYA